MAPFNHRATRGRTLPRSHQLLDPVWPLPQSRRTAFQNVHTRTFCKSSSQWATFTDQQVDEGDGSHRSCQQFHLLIFICDRHD
jgi:hypothetical protein